MLLQNLGFMLPWCRRMEKVIKRTRSKVKVWRWGPNYKAAIQFSVASPSFVLMALEKRKSDLQVLCEGIALFAALAWIDVEAAASLLNTLTCKPKVVYCDHVSGMPVLPAFVEMNLCKGRSVPMDVAWVNEMVTSMCCRLDTQNTSDEFRDTWTEIERLFGASSASAESLSGIEIPVRFVVGKFDDGPGSAVLAQTWEAIREVMDKNQIAWGWASSNTENPLSCSRGLRRDCFSSFILDSISALHLRTKNAFLQGEIMTKFVELIGEMTGSVRFSDVTFPLLLLEKEAAAIGRFSRMITRLLRTDSCSHRVQEDRSPIYHGQAIRHETTALEVRYTTARQFSAFCAALAVSQSCQSVHIFPFDSEVDSTRANAWQWLAYACFSKRARSRSAVGKIKITEANLTREDADAMAKIITSDNPEQELFTSDELTIAVPDDGDYHVDAKVRLYEGGTLMFESPGAFEAASTCGVKLVGVSESEWVDALVPGIGWCKLHRTSLIQCHSNIIYYKHIASLQLEIRIERSWGGVPRLLELVGPSLQTLRLELHWNNVRGLDQDLDVSSILSSCPNLEDLTVKWHILSAEAFVRGCEKNKSRLRRLQVIFDDYKVVANALKDESLQLTKHLQWWYCYRFRLERMPVAPLLEMLDVNRSLRWLTIETVRDITAKSSRILMGYDGKQLLVGDRLSITCKLAFLSVFDLTEKPRPSGRAFRAMLQVPDDFILSSIFQFATERAVRRVKIVYD